VWVSGRRATFRCSGTGAASSQFDLNVVRVAQHNERTAPVPLNIVDTRVRDPQRVKAVCPRFKSGAISVLKTDRTGPSSYGQRHVRIESGP
jgi:hypothetical protein